MTERMDLSGDCFRDFIPSHGADIFETVLDLRAAEAMHVDRLSGATILNELLKPSDARRFSISRIETIFKHDDLGSQSLDESFG